MALCSSPPRIPVSKSPQRAPSVENVIVLPTILSTFCPIRILLFWPLLVLLGLVSKDIRVRKHPESLVMPPDRLSSHLGGMQAELDVHCRPGACSVAESGLLIMHERIELVEVLSVEIVEREEGMPSWRCSFCIVCFGLRPFFRCRERCRCSIL